MDPRLVSGECVVYSTSKHWAAPATDSRWALLMVLGAFLLGSIQLDSTGVVVVFISRAIDLVRVGLFYGGLAWIIYNFVAWRSAEYTVTNRRVFCQEGLAHRRSSDTLLTSLSDVRTWSSSLGRTLGYGNIRLISSSGAAGEDTFTTVRDVDALKHQILEQKAGAVPPVHDQTDLAVATNGAAPVQQSQPAASPLEITEVLERLVKLRDAEAITPDEYATKKTDLLARL